MVRTTPKTDDNGSQKRLNFGLLESMTALWALCQKHASRATRKLASNSPRSQRLLTTISNKANQFRNKKRSGEELKGGEFGDGGLWQRTILMGDKCQPLDFPGVIYYDSDGKRLSELPMRSPRASPLPSYAFKSRKQEY